LRQTAPFIVLQIKKLKLRNHKILFILIFASIGIFAQQEDSLVIDYNYVNSIPQNADLYLNDELVGKTPMHFRWDTAAQTKVIKIKLRGYTDMVYSPAESENMLIKLLADTTIGIVYKEIVHKDKSFFSKRLKIVLIVLSSIITAPAIMAYYFKSKAIDKRGIRCNR
jgi:hypothetical protein